MTCKHSSYRPTYNPLEVKSYEYQSDSYINTPEVNNQFLSFPFSSMAATCFVQPLDLVKNRMQLMKNQSGPKPTSASVLVSVVKNEGFSTLYTGLSAGLLRQATYTTTRLG